ncbi:uncharacterized protein LOC130552902 [Triplophysa rosa]|uniref:uncharacterized protein LOC130552902 n=1 Tax=Triplophysa rosa TaxID=992332 RepID=UPI002545F53E|nr:uncharacterized protein LOC130552902 [Triplophysa rosa]
MPRYIERPLVSLLSSRPQYRGKTFKWLLSNDAGYAAMVLASHRQERERGDTSVTAVMGNKEALLQYAGLFPDVRAAIQERHVREGSGTPAQEDTLLVGFGNFATLTFKDLYNAVDKERKGFIRWVRQKKDIRQGTKMDALQKYTCVIISFNVQMESLGPDGKPGYDHVVRLANSLVDLRSKGFITQQKVDEIVTLWDKLSEDDKGALIYPARHRERLVKGRFKVSHSKTNVTPGADSLKRCFLGEGSGPAQWPNASRLVEAVCLALCRIYPASQTVAGVRVNRWAAILRDYRIIRDVVLDSPRLMAETKLQLFELNQQTLSQWHNARIKKQESEVLQQGIRTFASPLVASEPLPPVLFKHVEPVRHGHPAYEFDIPADASGQAAQRVRGQPSSVGAAADAMPAAAQVRGQPHPVQVGFAVPDTAHLRQATDTAAIAVPAATPPGPKVPRTTAWRRRKAAEAAAAQGATKKKRQQTEQYVCQKCGQPKTKEFGHSQFRGVHFCAKTSGKTVEQWTEEMRRGQR